MREVAPGKLRAQKSLRSHRALIEIDYDPAGEALQDGSEQEFRLRAP